MHANPKTIRSFMSLGGISGVISSAVKSVAQAFFFAVFAYILLYRPKKH